MMTRYWMNFRTIANAALLVALLGTLTGCGKTPAEFRSNNAYALVLKTLQDGSYQADQMEDLRNTLTALFGTPDQPYVTHLTSVPATNVVDIRNLELAAGPVSSDESGRPQGLYREHCAHCHGLTGDGAGPTAKFLNPYPRDYRKGVFKFKSTPKGAKPTHADLKRILMEGIPDTAMPSFRLLPENELDALIDYVKYLAIRGETERMLLLEMTELDDEERLVSLEDEEKLQETAGTVADTVTTVLQKWADAESQQSVIPAHPQDWDREESIAKGRELFYGPIANCVKCHGDSAQGDGERTDYDDWTKDYFDPKNEKLVKLKDVFVDRYAMMPPRNIIPRNLRSGAYRGGRRPIDLFRRIHNGIDGTPMPAASLKASDAAPDVKGLTTDDIWHIVDYVESLPYESISRPHLPQAENKRERM